MLNLTDEVILDEQFGIDLVGDADSYYELVGEFIRVTNTLMKDLEKSIAGGDWEQVVLKAHNIKGSSANLALNRIRSVATTIEKKARAGDTSEIGLLFSMLQSQCETLIETYLSLGKVIPRDNHSK